MITGHATVLNFNQMGQSRMALSLSRYFVSRKRQWQDAIEPTPHTWTCKCRVRQEPLAAMDVFTAFSGRNDLCRLVNYSTIIVKYVPFESTHLILTSII